MEKDKKLEVNWKEVLLEIYDAGIVGTYRIPEDLGNIDDENPLADKLGISGEVLRNSIAFLEDQNLINYTSISDSEKRGIKLTEKGFNVAHNIDKRKKQVSVKFILIMVTLFLALNGMFQFFSSLNYFSPVILTASYFIAVTLWSLTLLYFSNFLQD